MKERDGCDREESESCEQSEEEEDSVEENEYEWEGKCENRRGGEEGGGGGGGDNEEDDVEDEATSGARQTTQRVRISYGENDDERWKQWQEKTERRDV